MKRLLSAVFVLVFVLSALTVAPLTASATDTDAAATGGEGFSVATAAELRAALQYDGNAEITVTKDIEYTLPEGFEWQYLNAYSNPAWVVLGAGHKTLNLNGHRVYITDNFVTTAKYITETRYNVETGQTEEVFTLLTNSFIRDAHMIGIKKGSSLTVNGYPAGSEMMMDAQMPAYDQMMDWNITMFRQVFYLYGGELTVNGGEYQGGRRKTSYVANATKVKNNWYHDLDYFDESYFHYNGYAEYCIQGAAIYAKGKARVTVNGGTLIGHGAYGYNNRKAALQAFGSGTVVTVNDAVLKGYTGADAFRFGDGVIGTILAGEAIAEAPERMLWPDGKWHAESTYSYAGETNYDAVDVGRGNTVFEPELNTSVTTSGNKTTYAPISRQADVLRWADGTDGEITYYRGADMLALFDMPFTYFPTEDIPGVTHSYGYQWSLSKKNDKGNFVSVCDWQDGGHSKLCDLTVFTSYLTAGGTYRLHARMEENWRSTHSYNYKVTAASALVFRVEDYVVDALDIYMNAPTAGRNLSFDKDKVYNLPDYVTCDEIIWYDSRNTIRREGTVAEAGESYEVWVKLSTSVGKFAHSSALQNNTKLNNSPARITASDDSVYVRYTFPPCAKVIDSVELTAAAPVPGANPSFTVGVGETIYGVWDAEDSVQWVTSPDGDPNSVWQKMRPTDRFTVGHYYKLYVDVEAKAGYQFAVTSGYDTAVTSWVNGRRAKTIKTYDQDPEQIITVCRDYGKLKDPATLIDSVEISGVMPPMAGYLPSYTANVPAGAHYDVVSQSNEEFRMINGVFWFDPDAQSVDEAILNPTDRFELGRQYAACVSIAATSGGYEFAQDLTVSLNGKALAKSRYQVSGSFLVLYDIFTCVRGSFTVGDVDLSGSVTNRDAVILDRYIAGWNGYDAQIKSMDAADLSRDGEVTNRDAVYLDRYIAGWNGYDAYIIHVEA